MRVLITEPHGVGEIAPGPLHLLGHYLHSSVTRWVSLGFRDPWGVVRLREVDPLSCPGPGARGGPSMHTETYQHPRAELFFFRSEHGCLEAEPSEYSCNEE